jgi:hypothetical protein
MKNTIRFLRSESFIFLAILCVLVSQILHTAYLFKRVSRMNLAVDVRGWSEGLNWLHALVCASAIEAAILMFILNGKKRAAQVYALASFAGNLLYYQHWQHSVEQLVASTLISAMLSGSIWYFSDLFVERLQTGEEPLAEGQQAFICPECDKSYPTEQQLRGHLSGHARQKKKTEEEPAKVLPLFEGARQSP